MVLVRDQHGHGLVTYSDAVTLPRRYLHGHHIHPLPQPWIPEDNVGYRDVFNMNASHGVGVSGHFAQDFVVFY